jgi:hypothetical protein
MRNNLGLKLLALLLAVIIWLQLILVADRQGRVSLDLRLTNIQEADTLRLPPRKISCYVQGRGMDIIRLYFSRAYIQMDANEFWSGNSKNYLPMDIPENLQANVLGIISPGLDELGKIGKLTEEDFGKRTEGKKRQESPPVSRQKGTTSSGEQVDTRILTDLPIVAPAGTSIFPNRATIKVKGRAAALTRLPSGVTVTASAPDSRGICSLSADVPEAVNLLDITPKQVRAIQ